MQCHCYVCDSLAPCGHWGTGMNIVDHCHATNKDQFWVNQRKSFRLGKSQQVPIQKHATALPQVSQNSSFERWFWMIMKICDFWCFEASGFLTFKESRLNYDNWPWFFCFFFYITWCLWSVVRALFEESHYFLYMIIGLFFHQSGSLQTISDSVSGLV